LFFWFLAGGGFGLWGSPPPSNTYRMGVEKRKGERAESEVGRRIESEKRDC